MNKKENTINSTTLNTGCPVELTLSLIGNKWKVLILRELIIDRKRFGNLREALGISQKMLTQQLRTMEEDGLIGRKAYAVVPPKVEYYLTPLGVSLKPILDSMEQWGRAYQQVIH